MAGKHSNVLTAAALAATLFACRPEANPTGLAGPIAARRDANVTTEALASPGWQRTAGALVAQNKVAGCAGARLYAFVGVAQYLAVQRAEHDHDGDGEDERGGGGRRASDRRSGERRGGGG